MNQPLAVPETPEARIERVIDQMDGMEPVLTNGEKVFMFTLLTLGILDEAPKDVRAALLMELLPALCSKPSKLRMVCGVPCDGNPPCGTCDTCQRERNDASEKRA